MALSLYLHRLPAVVAAAGSLALAAIAWTRSPEPPQKAQGPAKQDEDEWGDRNELEDAMAGLKKNLKALSGTVGDPARNADTLRALANMEECLLLAKLQTPPHAERLPESQRPAFNGQFRADLARVLVELAQIEIEVLEGRNADARSRVVEKIVKMRDTAHEKYNPDQ